ncbi:MAG: PAS domain S-box protein [Kiritimatiellae bacterium]|nr:PAS domain S-box protein [Kiritimatiellia bacterium]
MTTVPIRLAPRLWARLCLGAVLVSILILGALVVRWAIRRQDHVLRTSLRYDAYVVAYALPQDRLAVLDRFHDRAPPPPATTRLHTQLRRLLQIDPAWKRIVLMGRDPDGALYIQVSSQEDGEELRLPLPPEPSAQPPPQLQHVFDTRKTEIAGPYRDAHGTWMSVLTPVIDAATGRLVSVASLDIAAEDWHATTWRAGLIPGLLTLSLLGLALLGTALHHCSARTAEHPHPYWRHLEASLVLALGTLLTLGGMWLAHIQETHQQRDTFLAMAHINTHQVRNAFHNLRRMELESLGRFFENSEEVTADEFQAYVDFLHRVSIGQAWGWIPRVPAPARDTFVTQARRDVDPDFELWEFDAEGGPTTAQDRPLHYPLLFWKPWDTHSVGDLRPGFDLASLESVARSIAAAAENHLPFASPPQTIGAATAAPPLMFFFHPVYRSLASQQPQGFVMSALPPHVFLQTVLNTYFDQTPLLRLDLLEMRERAASIPLATTTTATLLPPDAPPLQTLPLRWTLPILAFGRTYAVEASPTREFFLQHPIYLTWIAGVGGGGITLVLTLLTSVLIHRRKDLEHLVKQRTHALASSAQHFRQLARFSRTLTWDVNAEGLFMAISDVVHEVWGYTPDELIGQRYIYDLHPEHGRETYVQKMMAEFHARRPFRNRTTPILSKSGQTVWMITNGIPVLDDQGNLTGYQGFATDITAAHDAQQALRKSERQLRMLAENMQDVAWAIDAQSHQFIYVSPSIEQLLGCSPATAMAQSLKQLFSSAHYSTFSHLIKTYTSDFRSGQLSNKQFFTHQFDLLRADGTVVPTETISRFVWNDETGQVEVHGITRDITERKHAEDTLRESRRHHATLLTNLPGMAYRCANDPAWTMEFVSDGCRELTGYAPEDLINNRTLTFNDLIAPPYHHRLWEQWQDQLARHLPFEDEYEITTRSGKTKWVWEKGTGVYDEAGRVLALEGFIIDVTARKHANLERDRLMAAIEQSDDAVVITNAQGTIVYVNPAFCAVTGYSRQEALGQNPRILQSGVQDRAFYKAMWQTLIAGRTWRGQLTNKRKDGTLFTEVASISPVRDANGEIVQFVAVKRDISQQLRDQQERDTLHAQLLQAQKMESIGRLAGGIAHDFNNMLQAILGYVELCLEQTPPDQPLHADLMEIQKAAQRSKALTHQLQAFARKQPIRSKNLDLNAAIANMEGMVSFILGKQIQLETKPAADLGRIQVDPGHLDQLLTNLCINARDAIADRGTITIETRNVHVAHPIRNLHGDIPAGDYVRLSVTDTGSGMTPETLKHIFEPFFTTKKMGLGTGLGLATTYGLLQQNSAIPRILSQPGNGTAFHVFFPRQPAPPPPATIPDRDDSACPVEPQVTETILIVEDETALLQTTRRMLESLGYTVRTYSSATQALAFAQANPDAFDLLLTDVMMPDLAGPELVQRLQAVQPTLRYLYMSGYPANLFGEKGDQNPHVQFISKPFNRAQLARKIRAVLDG